MCLVICALLGFAPPPPELGERRPETSPGVPTRLKPDSCPEPFAREVRYPVLRLPPWALRHPASPAAGAPGFLPGVRPSPARPPGVPADSRHGQHQQRARRAGAAGRPQDAPKGQLGGLQGWGPAQDPDGQPRGRRPLPLGGNQGDGRWGDPLPSLMWRSTSSRHRPSLSLFLRVGGEVLLAPLHRRPWRSPQPVSGYRPEKVTLRRRDALH